MPETPGAGHGGGCLHHRSTDGQPLAKSGIGSRAATTDYQLPVANLGERFALGVPQGALPVSEPVRNRCPEQPAPYGNPRRYRPVATLEYCGFLTLGLVLRKGVPYRMAVAALENR